MTENPINPVTRVRPNWRSENAVIVEIDECALCGDSHSHGVPNGGTLSVGSTSERVAHCSRPGEQSAYDFKITEETDMSALHG